MSIDKSAAEKLLPGMSPQDFNLVQKEANSAGVPFANLLAMVAVESAGRVDAGRTGDTVWPVIRWEGHYFDRRLTGGAREDARRAGLAHPRAGRVKNPSSQARRYEILQDAIDFCHDHHIRGDLPYECVSIGVGQVMGSHWKRLGYSSAKAMMGRAQEGLDGQVELMIRYLREFDLLDELVAGDWHPLARGYNGPAYRKNRYATKMAEYAAKIGASTGSVRSGFLRMGSSGRAVRELQTLLRREAPDSIAVDGDFGPKTKQAVKAFQRRSGLTVDGIVGPETWDVLDRYRQDPNEDPGKLKASDVPEAKQAAMLGGGSAITFAGAREALEQAATRVGEFSSLSSTFGYIQDGLMVAAAFSALAGIGYGLYGYWKRNRTQEA